MRIVLFVNCFLPTVGGREIVVHYLARALKELGQQVRVVGSAGFWSQRKCCFEYSVHRWPTLLKGFFPDLERVGKFLVHSALRGCDVVHAHSTYPCGYAAALAKSVRNYPLVVTPHGEDIHVVPEIGYGQRLNPLHKAKIEHALGRADLITAISDSVEASLLDAGAMRERIRKVPNGIDVERFERPVEVDVRRWLELEEETRLILTVGNYRPCKGHESLIRAMPLIVSRDPRVRLIVVGRDTEFLDPLIEALDLRNRVILTGPIAFPICGGSQQLPFDTAYIDRLAAIYQASEIYVSAGIGEGAEGLSLALLDAMAAGLPVVATEISGNRDLLGNGEAGCLVPPSDPGRLAEAVLQLLGNGDLRARMSEGAKKIAQNYQWTNIARRYEEVYQEAREMNRWRGRSRHA